jgi:hypothetical protein
VRARKMLGAVITLAGLAVAPLLAPRANAQAWVPEKGTGDISVAYQNFYTAEHSLGDGSRVNSGKVRVNGMVQALDFGLTDKLALSVSLPYGWGKYAGPVPHQLPIDDGNYHGTAQDWNLSLRYNVRTRPLQVTPFFRIVIPSHHYEHFAHSAVGSQLHEAQFGVAVGRRLSPFLLNAYFQARYSFSFTAERLASVRPLRSRFDGEFGYLLTRRLAVRGLLLTLFSHNGYNFPQDYPPALRVPSNERWVHHDQVSQVNSVNVGGGVSFELAPNWSLYSSVIRTAWQTNGHVVASGLTIGMSWSFRTRLADRSQMIRPDAQANAHSKPADMPTPLCTLH